MEDKLKDFLLTQDYIRVKLKLTKTNHFEIKATINGVKGLFILDTGASSSCVGFECIEHFGLLAADSETKAAGAGGLGMLTQTSVENTLKLGRWKSKDFGLVIFDMSHVNEALQQYKAKPVHGIIGADILLEGEGIIDYSNKCFYLKQL